MLTQSDYEYVLNNSNNRLRQEFLDEIDLGEYKSFVKNLRYITRDETIFLKKNTLRFEIETFPDILSLLYVKERKSDIYVYPPAFSKYLLPKLNDFLSVLIYHECYHAKEVFENPEIIIVNRLLLNLSLIGVKTKLTKKICCFKAKFELRAYKNQLEKALTLECSENYITSLKLRSKLEEITLLNPETSK